MANYSEALAGVTQEALDDCDAWISGGRSAIYAYLKIGAMHGVTIAIERRCDPDGNIPRLARDGAVMRFLIPLGVRLEDLAAGLADGGCLGPLIDRLLAGHVLALRRESATGRLTPAAEEVRDAILDEIASLASPGGARYGCWTPAVQNGAPTHLVS